MQVKNDSYYETDPKELTSPISERSLLTVQLGIKAFHPARYPSFSILLHPRSIYLMQKENIAEMQIKQSLIFL